MAGEWEDTTLGKFLESEGGSIVTGPFGTALKASEYTRTGVPVISVSEVGFGRIQLKSHTPKVDPSVTQRLPKYLLRHGDIVFARKGASTAVERSALVSAEQDGWFLGSDGIRVRLPEKCFPPFVLYWLQSQRHRNWMKQNCVGTTMPALNEGIIKRIPLRLPPLPEQKAIAAVLGALDDKIELNRRMNVTLEAMARALFQSWFVDFDPVRAKAEGRPSIGIDEPTAALYPAQFQDSELGEIPQGWRVGTISDLAQFSRDSLTPANFPAEVFDHYSLPAFDEGRIPKPESGAAIKSNKFVVPHDAVLLSKLNPHIPRIWAPTLSKERRAICSTEFLVAMPKPEASREFLFCLFTSDAFSRIYRTLVTGTTGSHQRIKAESVLAATTLIPPAALIERFTFTTKPMLARMNQNIEQSRTLATLRDTLLPKLLSGELRMPFERNLQEAV